MINQAEIMRFQIGLFWAAIQLSVCAGGIQNVGREPPVIKPLPVISPWFISFNRQDDKCGQMGDPIGWSVDGGRGVLCSVCRAETDGCELLASCSISVSVPAP